MYQETQPLPVKVQAQILSPFGMEIVGDEIYFRVLVFGRTDAPGLLPEDALLKGLYWLSEEKPVRGCLKDFVRLANKSALDVLAFVQKRGVLGVAPAICISLEFDAGPEFGFKQNRPCRTVLYQEPVSIYLQLARQAKALVRVMQKLRGEISATSDTSVTQEEVKSMFSPKQRDLMEKTDAFDSLSPRHVYDNVELAWHLWTLSAKIRVETAFLWGEESQREEELYKQKRALAEVMRPEEMFGFGIGFSAWEDGKTWDKEAFTEQSAGAAILRNSLPHPKQRPSALFDVLAFQLGQEIILDECSYFCGGCGELKTKDTDYENKPRGDRATYCSKECKAEGRKRYEREYKSRRK